MSDSDDDDDLLVVMQAPRTAAEPVVAASAGVVEARGWIGTAFLFITDHLRYVREADMREKVRGLELADEMERDVGARIAGKRAELAKLDAEIEAHMRPLAGTVKEMRRVLVEDHGAEKSVVVAKTRAYMKTAEFVDAKDTIMSLMMRRQVVVRAMADLAVDKKSVWLARTRLTKALDIMGYKYEMNRKQLRLAALSKVPEADQRRMFDTIHRTMDAEAGLRVQDQALDALQQTQNDLTISSAEAYADQTMAAAVGAASTNGSELETAFETMFAALVNADPPSRAITNIAVEAREKEHARPTSTRRRATADPVGVVQFE